MGKILIEVEEDRVQGFIGRPVNERWARRFCRRAADNGGASFKTWEVDNFRFYVEDNFGDFLDNWVPRRYHRDVKHGWQVRFLADPWDVGHLYGYDAHTVCEG